VLRHCTGFQSVNECGSNWPVSCIVQVTIWSGPSVLGGWCSASRWRQTTSPSISQLQNVRRSSDTEQFWRQRLLCYRTYRIWNDLPSELRHADISFGHFRNML